MAKQKQTIRKIIVIDLDVYNSLKKLKKQKKLHSLSDVIKSNLNLK